jgi:hypothetical protein
VVAVDHAALLQAGATLVLQPRKMPNQMFISPTGSSKRATRAPVVVTMHARLARLFAAELGLSLSPPPVALQDIAVSLLWHSSYGRDPAHAWLRQVVVRLVAEL